MEEEEETIPLRVWKQWHTRLLSIYMKQAGATGAMKALLRSQDLTEDQLISVGRLNSIAVGGGWTPVVALDLGIPRIFPTARPLLGEIFRPEGYPKHISGDKHDMRMAFSQLVALECQAYAAAIKEGDLALAEDILSRLNRVGVKVDVESATWRYEYPVEGQHYPTWDDDSYDNQ
jgi:hypothetical protein